MERQQAKKDHAPTFACETNEQACCKNGSWPAVRQVMMIVLIAMKSRLLSADQRLTQVDNDAKPVNIGQNTSKCDELAIARVTGRRGCDKPACQEMRQRRHNVSATYLPTDSQPRVKHWKTSKVAERRYYNTQAQQMTKTEGAFL